MGLGIYDMDEPEIPLFRHPDTRELPLNREGSIADAAEQAIGETATHETTAVWPLFEEDGSSSNDFPSA